MTTVDRTNKINCTLCQSSISSSMLPLSIARNYTFPCTHTVHTHCLVNWTDHIHREEPTTKMLNCPECRASVLIPTKHSAEQILEWIKIAKKVIVFGVTMLGVGMGVIAAKKCSPLALEEVAQKVIGISPKIISSNISFPLATGALAAVGSYFISRSSLFQSLVSKVIASLYNWMHETNIQPHDIWLYKSKINSFSPEYQSNLVMSFFIKKNLLAISIGLKNVPFNDEEKAYLQPLITQLDSFSEKDLCELNELFTNQLVEDRPDLYARINRLGGRLLERTGNEETKEDLDTAISDMLVNSLKDKDSGIIHDSRMAARVTLVNVLEIFKECIEFKSNDQARRFKDFLSSLQEECHSSASTLLVDLQNELGVGFFDRPLIEVLTEVDHVFGALNKIRKEAFVSKGFAFNPVEDE